jgi:hypothetical protein
VTLAVEMVVTVTVTVKVEVFVLVTIWSTLIFQGGRMGQGKGVVASFRLVPKNKGSFKFLQVGS